MAALPVPRRHAARGLAALVVLSLLAPVGVSAMTYSPPDLQAGTIEQPADGPTVVGIQGFHFRGQGATKKPARVISVGPRGGFRWKLDGSRFGARWFYDVDPVGNGDLLLTATDPDGTVVVRIDRRTRAVVWTETFPYHDTHDVDLLPSGNLLIAHMRNFDVEHNVSNDRVVVYDRTSDEVVWEWLVRRHYPNGTDGGWGRARRKQDWTHVNDVDRVGDGLYLVSLRNFDQVVVVNRSTKAIELRLGRDGAHGVLYEQHNPDLIRGNGTVSILVADSENDRVVEYTRDCEGPTDAVVPADPGECEWERTWTLTGDLNWPRDADRLPNGNTLVVDTLNHRVIEVTPEGRIVWEYYATWAPYDAERIGTGDGSSGPPMATLDAPRTATVHNSAGLIPGTGGRETFRDWLTSLAAGTPLAGPVSEFAARWAHVTPWLTPNWMSGWDLALTIAAALVALPWGGVEAYRGRDRIRARLGALADRMHTVVGRR